MRSGRRSPAPTGSRRSRRTRASATAPASSWAATEQAGAANAADEVRNRLAAKNRDYEARFGYIFIVSATGQTADAMLAMLEQRLTNGPDEELRIAAEEQRKITQLRLAKLLAAPQSAGLVDSAERQGAGGRRRGGAPPQSKK